jgi:hypothetical protein
VTKAAEDAAATATDQSCRPVRRVFYGDARRPVGVESRSRRRPLVAHRAPGLARPDRASVAYSGRCFPTGPREGKLSR